MYLPKNLSFSTFTINSYYLPWLISFFVATTLILIILVIVIIICSSFKRKKKIVIVNTPNPVDGTIFIVKSNRNSLEHIKTEWANVKPDDITFIDNTTATKTNCFSCCCCYKNVVPHPSFEEKFGLLGSSKNIIKVDMREKERQQSVDNDHESVPDLSVAASDGISEHETGRTSHIDRELPPIPKISLAESTNANYSNSMMEPEITSLSESENYNELKQPDEIDTEQQNFESFMDSFLTMKNLESSNPSTTNVDKSQRSSIEFPNCCCNNHQDIISSDDLSSNDYDPTYAAIKRKKHSCQVCGVPSVYTPANSNRNSNLSLQSSSCLTSPTRNMNPQIINSLNNSTYASIAKLSKIIPENNSNKDQDSGSSSTIKRQRSISQGNIVKTVSYNVPAELQTIEIKINESNSKCNQNKELKKEQNIMHNPKVATISLWSLMASNRNSPYSMFPLIPERIYGQSVVDLIEKLRKSERSEKNNKQSCLGLHDNDRSFTPPVLLNSSFKKSGSIMNSKGRVWTPSSCQMLHGNTNSKSALYSPLKIFERNSTSYDFNFPELIGSNRKGNSSFQPLLTPPLSPLECFSSNKEDLNKLSASLLSQEKEDTELNIRSTFVPEINIKTKNVPIQSGSVYEDLDYESVLAADKEIEVINNDINLYSKGSDDYEYLLNSKLSDINEIELIGYSDDTMISRTRPISIHLYGDDSLKSEKSLKYRFDKCEMFGFSSVQMSPLMEQSIENSSSKTTLSSLSFHQFNRLISSEDSCAKSPPSAELSPSLDNFEISTETGSFLYNDLMWSKLNSAFDDYDTFE